MVTVLWRCCRLALMSWTQTSLLKVLGQKLQLFLFDELLLIDESHGSLVSLSLLLNVFQFLSLLLNLQ